MLLILLIIAELPLFLVVVLPVIIIFFFIQVSSDHRSASSYLMHCHLLIETVHCHRSSAKASRVSVQIARVLTFQ